MKRLFKTCTFILFSVCTIFVMGSCDSNKGKVKELTEQFVVFYNDGDKASVYDIFPSIKSHENLFMGGYLIPKTILLLRRMTPPAIISPPLTSKNSKDWFLLLIV